jgi:hypothetical protein
MNGVGQALAKLRHSIAPRTAALLGAAIGSAVAIFCALNPLSDFSFSTLFILLASLAPFGAVTGYLLWVSLDPDQAVWLRRIAIPIAFLANLGACNVLGSSQCRWAAFPDFWRDLERSMGWQVAGALMGFVFSVGFYAVVAGIGMGHLVGHVVGSLRQPTELGSASRTNGLWDRELD